MSLTNLALNNLLESINEYNIEELYNNNNIIEATSTINIPNTIISYNKEVNILFCNIYFINLYKGNTIDYLYKKHSIIYKEYNKEGYLTNINNILNNIESSSFNTLLETLGNNRYYFKNLDINLNGYKCRDCFYSNLSYKQI